MHAKYDAEIVAIAEYVCKPLKPSELAMQTAEQVLMDSLGCAMLALNYPACKKLLGPLVPGTKVENGARVPGTKFVLDPIQAAFNLGTMIRWLDFNDTWLAQEWGHPSDNIGGILSVADYLCRQGKTVSVENLLHAIIKAHEIQGVLALENSFNRVGLDHVLLVKIATTAVVTNMLGGDRAVVECALSQAWIDGQSLRTYRHAPNTGSRKSWAAGDSTSRGVRLAYLTLLGEMGYPSAISAKTWGFSDVSFAGRPIQRSRAYDCYVMENILFKISYPAEFHAQTAVEAAIKLYPAVKDRWDEIEKIELTTQEPAVRIIDKTGPLYNPADRDHCLQYMVAVGLGFGELTADHYEDAAAADPLIDNLRSKMVVTEDKQFSTDYLDPDKRAIPNAVQVFFKDNSNSEKITITYPLGHRLRRTEGLPVLQQKFNNNLATIFNSERVDTINAIFAQRDKLYIASVADLVDTFCDF